MATTVAGIDFGTKSVRVSLYDYDVGRIASTEIEYELIRKTSDPDWATQRPVDHMDALQKAFQDVLKITGIPGDRIEAIAIDTTGSTVVPVDKHLEPIDDYYMWCDHRAKKEASEITQSAHVSELEHIHWCGGAYSSEWGLAKVLHWLRHHPDERSRFASAFEHCDLIAAQLCGVQEPGEVRRSVCAAGHKWMVHPHLGGLPQTEFLNRVDPLLGAVRDQLTGPYGTSFEISGYLGVEWAKRLGLKAGIPIPVGALDAHWDAIGAGIREGDVVNVVGTSTCIMAITKDVELIPGVSGIVDGSIHPDYWGIEAGLSAVGDIFDAIARRAGTDVASLAQHIKNYKAGQTGLLRLAWDNGDRNVLANPELSGVTLGWTLNTSAADELMAAIEGTAFHTRIILERLTEYTVPVNRVINGGGIPQKNPVLNQIYANVFKKAVLVPEREVTSLGAAIFAFLAAGVKESVQDLQDRFCPKFVTVEPDPKASKIYDELYDLYRHVYFALGDSAPPAETLPRILPALREIASGVK